MRHVYSPVASGRTTVAPLSPLIPAKCAAIAAGSSAAGRSVKHFMKSINSCFVGAGSSSSSAGVGGGRGAGITGRSGGGCPTPLPVLAEPGAGLEPPTPGTVGMEGEELPAGMRCGRKGSAEGVECGGEVVSGEGAAGRCGKVKEKLKGIGYRTGDAASAALCAAMDASRVVSATFETCDSATDPSSQTEQHFASGPSAAQKATGLRS